MTIKINKKTVIIILTVIIVLGAGIFGISKYNEYRVNQLPYYTSTKSKVILSGSVDKASDKQEEAFYDFGKSVVDAEQGEMEWSNFDDQSIYVKKLKGKANYYIRFKVKPNISTMYQPTLTTSMKIHIKQSDIRKDSKYTYFDYNSDFTDLDSDY